MRRIGQSALPSSAGTATMSDAPTEAERAARFLGVKMDAPGRFTFSA